MPFKQRLQRLRTGQLLMLAGLLAPALYATYFCWRWLLPRYTGVQRSSEFIQFRPGSVHDYAVAAEALAVGLMWTTPVLAALAWLTSVVRDSPRPVTSWVSTRVVVALVNASALVVCTAIAAVGCNAASAMEHERDRYMQWAALAGIIEDKSEHAADWPSATVKAIENPAAMLEPDMACSFYSRMISSNEASPALARHMVGPLIRVLVEAQDQNNQWPDHSKPHLSNRCVEGINRLSGQNFPMPEVPLAVANIRNVQTGDAIRRVIPDRDAVAETVAQLHAWLQTVADRPEWEPLPIYEIDSPVYNDALRMKLRREAERSNR